ncbi:MULTISPECIES: DNA polymerase III subunit theta [Pantoea]|jgi:DNA polymerase-3 subunit theta|uniref:DNA polymerase III subunit theta n=1 Tax=Pantoea TaxID=53335 RepID=UPI000EA0AF41|nr:MULTISPECIES: DNA polymerase III subunit theta [Pantoea]MBZ6385481.1 DNA polymerase III subunit theta [Pantoea piersonii]MBZ6398975.1 DNA polymerase III subunit theta [Pantoea piersonii]MBZ6407527.1 DNA polymerase III subunit theta [Pantoea piersonii]MBZ6425522.1 DNA polymerase III subunit theta [Pantoea piersonii]NYB00954.1 DNA polymerase III subunit theta [Pantoea piersonii]
MSHNIAARSKEERDRMNVDLAASGVAYKERMNMPVVAYEAEMQQPEALREYFQERLRFYREESNKYPRGTDPVYQKEEGK